MHASTIITVLLASCATARVIPAFLSTTLKAGVIARTTDESAISRREESTVIRGLRETMVPGRGPRIDDIVEVELTR
jgi:hypothetical protein